MKIGVPKEIHEGERRVATTPEVAERLKKLGFSACLEAGAGLAANYLDDAYREAGVEIVDDAKTLWAQSDIVMKVRARRPIPSCVWTKLSYSGTAARSSVLFGRRKMKT